jgi:hypothetical protein
MLWLAALAITAGTPQIARSQPMRAAAEAQASVRIVSGTRIHLDGHLNADAPRPSDGIVHTEGIVHSARLLEFQYSVGRSGSG